MRCYFLNAGRVEGVEVMPAGLSDHEAIERTKTLLAKRKGPFDSFEVWEGSRFVFRRGLPVETPQVDNPRVPSPIGADAAQKTR
jgi:hypothetical protein